ncbi:MAG: sigma-70 family RNA polymerase sigma factor [Planctomycetota bacterium]
MDRSASGISQAIRLAREGKSEALDDLLASYRNYLRLLAATSLDPEVRSKADASDVVQETLLKAHQGFRDFRGTTEREWITWVRQILLNNLADLHRRFSLKGRKVSRERSLEASMDRSSLMLRNLVAASGPSPSQEAEQREMSVVLADTLAELEPEDREVVILRNLQELDWNEIARRTGRSADAARMLWTRALQRVGGLLKERMR